MTDEMGSFVSISIPSWLLVTDSWYLVSRSQGIAIILVLIDSKRNISVREEIASEREVDGLERSREGIMRIIGEALTGVQR